MTCCTSVFFFSSRRRHTRCSRDWSSDVCSSDLHVINHLLLRLRYFMQCPQLLLLRQHRSEEHTSELQSRLHLVCRLLLEKKKKIKTEVDIPQIEISLQDPVNIGRNRSDAAISYP